MEIWMLNFKLSAFLFFMLPSCFLCANENSVQVETNNGKININFSSLSDETKEAIIAGVVSDELVRIGNRKYSQGQLASAIDIYQSARLINRSNRSAFMKFYEAKVKVAIHSGNQTATYKEIMSEAQRITDQPPSFYSENYKMQGILYSFASSLYSPESPEHKLANLNLEQTLGILSRIAGNEMAEIRVESALRENADASFNKKAYVEAIYHYAILYETIGGNYPLSKITEIISLIDDDANKRVN